MKALYTILLLLGLSSIKSQTREVIFSEDFNNDQANFDGWEVFDRDRDGSSWEIAQGSEEISHAGWDDDKGSIMTVASYKLYPQREIGPLDSDDVLISPKIDIPSVGDITLTYKIGVAWDYLFGRKMNDLSYQFFILVDDEKFYPTLKPLDEKRFSNSKSAEIKVLNLNKYRGKKIRLCWRQYDAFGQFLLLLDDIKITKTSEPSIYPTVVEHGVIHTDGFSGIKSYKIYNAAGRLIKSGDKIKDIEVGYLPKGYYILEINDEKVQKVFKFIKN